MAKLLAVERERKPRVAIIGTGNYGIAIGRRILSHGFQLVYGSREPNLSYIKDCFKEFNDLDSRLSVAGVVDAWHQADQIVILAVSASDSVYDKIASSVVSSLSQAHNDSFKVVIEISNWLSSQDLKTRTISNAEKLQNMFNQKLEGSTITYKIAVVKAFNLLSSYSISSIYDEQSNDKDSLTTSYHQLVPVAGDNPNANELVISFCKLIGFTAYEIGSLSQAALKLEASNLTLFGRWHKATVFCLLAYVFNAALTFWNYYFFPKQPRTNPEPHNLKNYLKEFNPLSFINKTTGFTSLQLLTVVYLAYIVASIYQLTYGTKYKKFPRWLDLWMKSRKHIGIWSFVFATIHVFTVVFIVSPNYLATWYKKPELNQTIFTKMTMNGEINVLTGVFAYLLYICLALTSISAIGITMNFREWRFVQSKLGHILLFMALLHDVAMYFRMLNERNEKNYTVTFLLTRTKLYVAYLPVIVLLARLVLDNVKPIRDRLDKIRSGSLAKNKQSSSA